MSPLHTTVILSYRGNHVERIHCVQSSHGRAWAHDIRRGRMQKPQGRLKDKARALKTLLT